MPVFILVKSIVWVGGSILERFPFRRPLNTYFKLIEMRYTPRQMVKKICEAIHTITSTIKSKVLQIKIALQKAAGPYLRLSRTEMKSFLTPAS